MSDVKEGKARRRCFVTVGTTRFDALINALYTAEVREALERIGVSEMTIQHGRSPIPVSPSASTPDIKCTTFDYCSSSEIGDHFSRADVVISHAGAGSLFEALSYGGTKVIAVINEGLMDNHQEELARVLQLGDHIFAAHVRNLPAVLAQAAWKKLAPLPERDAGIIGTVVAQEVATLR